MLCVCVAAAHTKHTASILPLDGALPDSADATVVLRALMTLQVASVDWHRATHELATCCGCTDGNPTSAPMTPIPVGRFIDMTITVSAIVRKFRDACSALQLHVLPFHRVLFGDTVESIDELVARGQLFVVMTCLQHLREVMPPASLLPLSTDPVRALLRAFPNGIDDVIRCAELELHRVTSLWTELRRREERLPQGVTCPILPDYQRLHRAAVLAAQREMNALIDHPRFGAFLRAGLDRHQPPQIRTDCARIAIALQVRLSADLIVPLSRAEATGAPADTWLSTTHQPVRA